MKKYLLPESGSFYKANLHCHSTLSDGRWTVEQIKENYKAEGYSIVAYTDHDVFLTHNELRDEDFLPLNGYELAITAKKVGDESPKTCHICFIALDEDRKVQKIFYECKHLTKNIENACLAEDREYITKIYDPSFISGIMAEGRADRFFVTYNHPTWSLETKDEYCNYHGMHAMEIVNYGCVTEGYTDRNDVVYDEMLRGGEKIFCVATDDNHDAYPLDHPKNDSFGGFTVIKADKLEYASITDALVAGNFYASEGPEIHELWYEDGKVHIRTSDAVRIVMTAERRKYKTVTANKKGDTVNEAVFDIIPDLGRYVRFTVIDENGKMANTNAYYLSDFCAE